MNKFLSIISSCLMILSLNIIGFCDKNSIPVSKLKEIKLASNNSNKQITKKTSIHNDNTQNEPDHKQDSHEDLINIDDSLQISRPNKAISVETDSYFVTGIANPSKPLSVNNKNVPLTDIGTFGIELPIYNGENIFVFKQEKQEKKVYIYKNQSVPSNHKSFPQTEKKSNNFWPNFSQIINDYNVNFSCIAPRHSNVFAELDGHEFKLEPTEDYENNFMIFSKKVTLKDKEYQYDYYNAGPVKYIITINGEESEILSDGYVIFSNNTDIPVTFVTVSKSRASIFENPDIFSSSLATIKKGCTFGIDPNEENDEWYKLDSFGWILKSSVAPANSDYDKYNVISNISFDIEDKTEKLILEGCCKPIFGTLFSKTNCTIRLFYTKNISIDSNLYSESTIINNISVNETPVHSDVSFTFKKPNDILGYNVEYDGDNTIIYFKKKPTIVDSSKPFKNLTVSIDAGHGGVDYGEKGILGETGGSSEKDFNLAYALTLKDKLTEMGANVIVTRHNDLCFSSNNIIEKNEIEKPDMFISIHTDSIDDSLSPNNNSGFSINYHNKESSKDIANIFEQSLSNKYPLTKSKGCKQYKSYICNNTFCPSVIIKIGALSNPQDVSLLVKKDTMDSFAESISNGIKQYFSN